MSSHLATASFFSKTKASHFTKALHVYIVRALSAHYPRKKYLGVDIMGTTNTKACKAPLARVHRVLVPTHALVSLVHGDGGL